MLVLAALLASWLPLPWRLGGLAFGLAGMVAAVHALLVAVRARVRGALPVLLGVSMALCLSWVITASGTLLLWPQERDRQECLAGALTVSAQHECESQYEQAVEDLLGTPGLPRLP